MYKRNESYPLVNRTAMDDVSTSSVYQPTRRRQDRSDDGRSSFLEILHKLLCESEEYGHNIASWNADGLSFCVNDSQRFDHYLIPVYFGSRNACCSTGHHQNLQHKDEPLETFDAFLGRLQSSGFHCILDERSGKYIYGHPSFVRDAKYSALQMTSNKPKSFFRQQNSWPMPASNRRDLRTPNILLRSTAAYNSRPFRASISKRKRKRNRDPRRRVAPSPHHPIEDRLSIMERTLRRKPSARISQRTPEHPDQSQPSIHELLSGASFCDTENDNNTSDDYEPLCISTTCNASLDVIEQNTGPARPYECIAPTSPVMDVEPLDPSRHDDNDSLHEDIAEALARI